SPASRPSGTGRSGATTLTRGSAGRTAREAAPCLPALRAVGASPALGARLGVLRAPGIRARALSAVARGGGRPPAARQGRPPSHGSRVDPRPGGGDRPRRPSGTARHDARAGVLRRGRSTLSPRHGRATGTVQRRTEAERRLHRRVRAALPRLWGVA